MPAFERSALTEMLSFIRQSVRNFRETGAIAPSSPYLARLIVAESQLETAGHVLEIGAGTGVFTREIRRRLPPSARFFVLEKNPHFARLLRQSHPDLKILETCASRISAELSVHSVESLDRVVSGLPWASMPGDVQQLLLREIHGALCPGGLFTTFAYFGPHLLPAGRQFRERLHRHFRRVTTTRIEFRNLPPAFVYRAER